MWKTGRMWLSPSVINDCNNTFNEQNNKVRQFDRWKMGSLTGVTKMGNTVPPPEFEPTSLAFRP